MTDAISVYKAQPVGETEAADLHLVATEEFPDYDFSPERGRERHGLDGEKIVAALEASLPGGTLDAVLWMMLRSRQSRLRVPVRKPTTTGMLRIEFERLKAQYGRPGFEGITQDHLNGFEAALTLLEVATGAD